MPLKSSPRNQEYQGVKSSDLAHFFFEINGELTKARFLLLTRITPRFNLPARLPCRS